MSRSNPAKRKPRSTRHTTLIVVEGASEAVLIKHLKNHFGHDAGSRITVKSSSGNGDAVLKTAVNSFEAFDRRVALYDADWQPQEKTSPSRSKTEDSDSHVLTLLGGTSFGSSRGEASQHFRRMQTTPEASTRRILPYRSTKL
jgi:hypothetical protein